MKLARLVKQLRGDLDIRSFGQEIGVSHTAIVDWESGANVSPFNRIRLLDYARRSHAAPEIVRALESAQPEVRP